jgi:protein TonB
MNEAISRPGSGRHPVGLTVVVALHVVLATALVLGSKVRLNPPIERHDVVPLPPPPHDPQPIPKMPEAPPMGQPHASPLPIPPDAPSDDSRGPDLVPGSRDVTGDAGPGQLVTDPPPVAHPSLARSARIDAAAASCAPEYPTAAARAGTTGVSRIRFTVDALGRVVRAETLQSAGPTREHRLLDRAASDALQHCPITPGADADGRPMGTTVDVEYHWTLN